MTETVTSDVRHFTVEQANATLPLVQRIVRDLMDLHPRWRAAVAGYEAAQVEVTANGETDSAREARLAAGRLAGEIESCLDELTQIGCHFKDFESGLVDFPALREEKVVYLCWRAGEDRVEHWHELTGGVEGRQPIDATFSPVSVP
ncbi:MAG: DUF2203 domain-containing protein [Gemmatimonadota bacterium]